jgi:hypothetical protein
MPKPMGGGRLEAAAQGSRDQSPEEAEPQESNAPVRRLNAGEQETDSGEVPVLGDGRPRSIRQSTRTCVATTYSAVVVTWTRGCAAAVIGEVADVMKGAGVERRYGFARREML